MLDPGCRERFVELAGRHHVLGLVLSSLLPLLDPSSRWDGVREEWSGLLRGQRRRAAIFDLKRDRVSAILRAAGIRAIALKGAALRLTVYSESVERELEDLDLLVRDEEVDRAVEVLCGDGYSLPHSREMINAYRRHHFHYHLRGHDGHIVEIHWALIRADRSFSLTPEEIWEGAVEIRPKDGVLTWIPSPHHLVLQIVLQNLQEGFSRLGRVVDIDRIVSDADGFDWPSLVAAAQRGGLQSAVAMSLQLSHRLLGTVVPATVARDLSPSRAARFHLAIMGPEECLMRQTLRRAYSAAALFELWLVRRSDQRMRQLSVQLGEAKFTEMSSGEGPQAAERWARLVKLGASQLLAYATALGSLATRRGRTRSRFWSHGEGVAAGIHLP